jgi:hypothetical protein
MKEKKRRRNCMQNWPLFGPVWESPAKISPVGNSKNISVTWANGMLVRVVFLCFDVKMERSGSRKQKSTGWLFNFWQVPSFQFVKFLISNRTGIYFREIQCSFLADIKTPSSSKSKFSRSF